jgi:hypothetical protein
MHNCPVFDSFPSSVGAVKLRRLFRGRLLTGKNPLYVSVVVHTKRGARRVRSLEE